MSIALTTWITQNRHRYPERPGDSVHHMIRPAAVYGVTLGLDDQAIRRALLDAHIPLPPRRALAAIMRTARQHVNARAGSSSSAARSAERLAVARRMVGRILTPLHIPARQQVLARRVMAVIGSDRLAVVDAGGDPVPEGVTVSVTQLAIRLGVAYRSAERAVKLLVELGWITRYKKLSGGAWVYKIRRLSPEAGAVADAHAATVDALADGRPELDPIAAVIATAGHPAWGWVDAPPSAWLTAVLDAAGLRGARAAMLGGTRRPGVARAWVAGLGPDLTAGLDAAGVGTEQLIAERRATEAAKKAEDDARKQAAKERAAMRRKARRLIQRVAPEAGALSPHAETDGRRAWATAIKTGLAGVYMDADMKDAVAWIVADDLRKAGDELAEQAGAWVVAA